MERNRCWFRLKLLLAVAMCLVETARITNQVKDQRSPETRRSLVAMVEERSDLNTIPAGSIGIDTSAKANPSTEAESNVEENNRPKPGEANPNKSVFGEYGSTSKKTSVAEALHLLRKGQIPVEGRSLRALRRDTFPSKQGETDVESLVQRTNGHGVVSKKTPKLYLGKTRNTNRMRREVGVTTSMIANESTDKVTKTTSNPSPSTVKQNGNEQSRITTQNVLSATTSAANNNRPTFNSLPPQSLSPVPPETSTEAPEAAPKPSDQTTSSDQGVLTTVTTLNPLPVPTSMHSTKEQVQVTSQATFVSTAANRQPISTPRTSTKQPEPPVIKPSAPTSRPKNKLSTKHITTVSHTTASLISLPTSPWPTNATSTLPESKVQDVKERTPDGDCANGNCDSAVIPLNQWTDDAYWACGSLLTILLILTVAVLYTGLWRKRNHMSNPISDVSCHAQASPSRKSKTDIKDFLKMKLRHIKNLTNSPLSTSSSLSKQDTRQHNGSSTRSTNGRAGNQYPHRYDRLPLLVADENEDEEEFTREWGPRTTEHNV
ncbi:mucin-5AC-like [Patiria miniata]|uniref:Uncharacterized protein n=1 Tax=Patiria miniata TaxID=46514 RepID=A0A914A7Q8_PATMI|nr:mucin-5AC-like [Patiria miniata]